jgi:hypothetical protein
MNKAARQKTLVESLLAAQQPDTDSARAQLGRLLGDERLVELDQVLLAIVSAGEPEQETRYLDGLIAHHNERRQQLLGRLLGRAQPDQSRRTTGFDGGARPNQPQPLETHEQTLLRVLASREADVGRHL